MQLNFNYIKMARKVYVFWAIFLSFALCAVANAEQVNTAQTGDGQVAQEPDRMAEDFVITSLCIADPTEWQDDALGISGHAFLRLQCPFYGLDYCFSYEGERVNDNIFRYINGDTKMGMFAIKTDEYLEDYRRWNRSVHEYFLDLPAEAEVRLWEIMDNHLTGGITLRQDLNKYGCAITVVRYVKQALAGTRIEYNTESEFARMTRREIGYQTLKNHPWIRLSSMVFTDSRYDNECPIDEKLIVPADLAKVWQEAKIEGRILATYKGDLVEGAQLDESEPWFTPMLLAICLLLISIAVSFSKYGKYWNMLMVSIQALIGVALIILFIMSKHIGGSAFLILAVFNPLPLILWRWRKYWGVPYGIILGIGSIVLCLLPHMLIDPAVLVMAWVYVVIFCSEVWSLVKSSH